MKSINRTDSLWTKMDFEPLESREEYTSLTGGCCWNICCWNVCCWNVCCWDFCPFNGCIYVVGGGNF